MNPEPSNQIWITTTIQIFDVIKIFLGAFFGAACAFAYERRRKKDEERSKRTIALRDAQFAILTRINSLLVIHTQHLASQAKNLHRWVELPPVLYATTPTELPLAELSFLLDDVDPNLLGEIVVARNKYDTALKIIAYRNEKHDEFQKLFEQGKVSERLQVQLTNFTDALYDQVSDTLVYLHSIHSKLESVMRKHFKGINILRLGKEVDQMILSFQVNPADAKKRAAD